VYYPYLRLFLVNLYRTVSILPTVLYLVFEFLSLVFKYICNFLIISNSQYSTNESSDAVSEESFYLKNAIFVVALGTVILKYGTVLRYRYLFPLKFSYHSFPDLHPVFEM
jgi:hypothetical protein